MNRLFPYLIVSGMLFLGACATSEPVAVVEDTPDAAPVSPLDGLNYVSVQNGSVALTHSDSGTTSMGESGSTVLSVVSSDRSHLAMATKSASGSVLTLIGTTNGSTQTLHEGGPDLVFSGVWTADGSRFYFGFYAPEGNRMGAGDIRWVNAVTGASGRVGCSASKAVLAVLRDGSLLVRNTDNMYQVSADGCDTLRTVDARKMYHVTVSPDGSHLAYVLRDLVYNRDSRQYEPDSTLYMELTTGSDPVKVVGDKYAPRNMSWSPDGSEILFDVGLQDDTDRRAVSVYTLASARSSYLIAPTDGVASLSHASFSPNGRHVVYRSTESDGTHDWMVKTTGSQFSQVINSEAVRQSGQLSWVDDDTGLILTDGGESELVHFGGANVTSVPLGATILAAWR